MNYIRFKKSILTFLVITLLLFTSLVAMGVTTDKSDVKDNFSQEFLCKNRKDSDIKLIHLSSDDNLLNSELESNPNDIYQISSEIGDEYNLEMISFEDKKLVSYEYEENGVTTIRYRYSTDYDKDFSNIEVIDDEYNLYSPCLSLVPGNDRAYGAFLSEENDSTLIYEVEFSSLTDPERPVTSEPFSKDDFYNFKSADIVYTEELSNVPYLISIIGSTDYETAECVNSPMFFFRSPNEPDKFTIAWDPNINGCSNLQIENNENNTLYGICEINNGTNKDLFFFNDDPVENGGGWEKGGLTISHQIITSNGNLLNPKISVDGNNIHIVAETDVNGKNELVLYVSSDLGNTWSEPTYFTENLKPSADFRFEAKNLEVSFIDLTTDIDGYVNEYYWNLGDGNISAVQNPTHVYESPGTYTINFTVTDNDGSNDTILKDITVTNKNPVPDFTVTPSAPIKNENVSFNSSVLTYNNRVVEEYSWHLGEGIAPVISRNVTYKYTENGTYVVNLTVTDNESDIGFVEKIIHIGFVADFSYTDKLYFTGENIDFSDLSQAPDGQTITDHSWDFGDGTSSTDQNPVHSYSEAGYYMVTLRVENNLSHNDTISKLVRVRSNNFVPKYPDLYVYKEDIFVTYMIANNLLLVNSNDQGGNWTEPDMINDKIFTVNEGYKNNYILNEENIIFADFRNANSDIFFYSITTENIDLAILNVSLVSKRPVLKTKNHIFITVANLGDARTYEGIQFNVTYKCEDEDRKAFDYPYEIVEKLSPGETYNLSRPLFSIKWPDYFDAMVDLTEITDITVRIDPENATGDTNLNNNVYVYDEGDIYKEIFPVLGKRTGILLILKFIDRIRDIGN